MLSTSQSYRLIASNLDRSLARTAAQPPVKRESAYYLANISKVKSISDFLGNDRLFRFAMKAFGMDDLASAKGLVKKALTEGIDSRDAFANRLVDPRLREFVSVFNFPRYGVATTAFDAAQEPVVDRYVRLNLEASAGASNEGVRLALYFERKASSISSPYAILSDKALYQVVQTALDLPNLSAGGDIDRKAQQILAKLPMSDLKDARKVKALIDKFTVRWEMANPSTAPAAALSLVSSTAPSISSQVLETLQRLKLGGS